MKKIHRLFSLLFALILSCSKTEEEFSYSPTDWMSQLIELGSNQEIALIDICLPSSHDAGTYVLTSCTSGANACNTQTQHLDMKAQLEAGIRIFDIRPVLSEGEYFTQHVTECNGYGCKGDLVENMLQQIKNFLDAHAELVILKFGNFCETGADDTTFTGMVNRILDNKLYKEPAGETQIFIKRPLKNILQHSGKALVIYNGTLQDSPANRAKGMFTGSVMPTVGKWSNTLDFNFLKTDQLAVFSNFTADGTMLFELSWTLTQDAQLAVYCALSRPDTVSIYGLAQQANGKLKSTIDELLENGSFQKGKIPNVISVDFVGEFVTQECIRVSRVNLD